MPDGDTTEYNYFDPDTESMFDPESYVAYKTVQYGSEYPEFDTPYSSFESQAKGELNPLYKSVYDELSMLESQQKVETAETYDELLKNMQEGYNQRGTFFSGEAMVGESKLNTERGRTMDAITGKFGTARSELGLQKMENIQSRAEALQTKAYEDYLRTREATIQTQVFEALKEFYPQYQETIQAQLEDENALWLDIPYEDVYGEEQTTSESGGNLQVDTSGWAQPERLEAIASMNPNAIANTAFISGVYLAKYGRTANATEQAKFKGMTVRDVANYILGQSGSPFA